MALYRNRGSVSYDSLEANLQFDSRQMLGAENSIAILIQNVHALLGHANGIESRFHWEVIRKTLTAIRRVINQSQTNRYKALDWNLVYAVKEATEMFRFDNGIIEAAFKIYETLLRGFL